VRSLNWTTKGSKGEIYDCCVKVIDETKIIYFLDCTCWNFVNRRLKNEGMFSDKKFYAEPCKHLKPVVDALLKQGYTLKTPKPMTGTDKCTPELRRFIMERSGGICEVEYCEYTGVEVHRKIPRTNGGKYNKDNCMLLCKAHHEFVTYHKWHGTPGAKK